jgi:hypothetical protein
VAAHRGGGRSGRERAHDLQVAATAPARGAAGARGRLLAAAPPAPTHAAGDRRRAFVSVGSKQVRKPKKDGWFEHGQNCHEYLEVNFGLTPYKRRAEPQVAIAPVFLGENAWML